MAPLRHFIIVGVALVLLLASHGLADVTVTSFTEHVHTEVQDNGPPPQSDVDDIQRLILPPISMAVTSTIPVPTHTATASITIQSYTGPATVGLSSSGLGLQASLDTIANGSAFAQIEVLFTLNNFHPYSFSDVGDAGTGFTRYASLYEAGVSNFPNGSGVLPPGNYGVLAFSTSGPLSFNFEIGAAVPEPATAFILVPHTIWILTRRRRQD